MGWKLVHSNVIGVQSCNMSANYSKSTDAFKISFILTFCDVFSCMLLTVIKWFLLQFGVISTCKFSKTTNCTCPMSLCNFVVFEKLTYAYWHQIALEMMLLPILTNVTLEKGN